MAEYPRLVRVRVLVYQAGKETQHSLHSMYRKFTKSAATCFAIPHSKRKAHCRSLVAGVPEAGGWGSLPWPLNDVQL